MTCKCPTGKALVVSAAGASDDICKDENPPPPPDSNCINCGLIASATPPWYHMQYNLGPGCPCSNPFTTGGIIYDQFTLNTNALIQITSPTSCGWIGNVGTVRQTQYGGVNCTSPIVSQSSSFLQLILDKIDPTSWLAQLVAPAFSVEFFNSGIAAGHPLCATPFTLSNIGGPVCTASSKTEFVHQIEFTPIFPES